MTFDEYYNRWKKGQNGLATSSNTNNSSISQNQNTSSRSSFDEFYDKWKKNRENPTTFETNKKFTNTSNANNKTTTSNTSNNQATNSNISNQNKKSEEELIKEEQQKKAEKSANAHNTAYNSLSDQEKKYYDSYMQKTSGGANSTVGPKKSSIPVSEAEKKAFQKYQSIYQKNNNETVLMSKEQYKKYQDEHPELVKKQAEEAQRKAEEYKKNTPLVERIGNTLGDWQKTLTDNAGKATSDAAKGIINLAAWGVKKNPLVSSNPKVQEWIDENKEKLTDPLESFNSRMDSEDSLASYDAERQGKVSGFVNDKIMPTLGQLLPSFLMGTAGGKVASGLTQFAVSEGSYQDDAKARGMNEDETMAYSTIMAGFEGLSEGLTWGNAQKVGALTKEKVLLKSGKTAKDIVGEQAKKQAIKEANASIIKRFGLNAFENAFQEGITEPVQELTAKGVSLGLTGKDKSNWENMLQRSGESAFVGAFVSVLLGGSSAGVSSATEVTNKMVDNAQNGRAINDGISDSQIISAYNDSAKVVDADKIMNDTITRQNQKYNVALNEINNKLNQGNNTNIIQNDNVMEKSILNDDHVFQFEKTENEKVNNLGQDFSQHFDNSEQAHRLFNTFSSIIKETDTNIRLNNQLESNINGKIYTGNDGSTTIEVNPNSSRSGEFIVMHELTHGIGTEELKTLINDYAKTNADFDSALTELKKTYKTDDVSDEVMCDISANLLGNEDFIQKIATEKPSTFRKIYNSIKSFVKKITGKYSQEDFIRDLELKWENAYQKNKDSISKNIGNNSFYSIQENENGKFIKVDTDQNIFDGVQEKDYNKVAKKYIQEYLLGDTKLSENENVNINNKSAKKYTNPGYKQANFSEKMKLTPELKNVLEIAQYVDETPANKDNAKFSHYKYYTFDFELGGKMFTGNINIGVDNNGNNVFYEINKIHKRSNQLGTSLDSGVASNNSIPQSVDEVKENIKKQESENNSDSFNLPRNDDQNDNKLDYQGSNLGSGKASGKNITVDQALTRINDLLDKHDAIYDNSMSEAIQQLKDANKNPEKEIKIYRASPSDEINSGDWVYLSREQAERWTKTHFGKPKPGYTVTEKTVKACDVDWTGKNLDFVYAPQNNTSNSKNSISSNTWYDWLDTHFKPSKNVTNFKDIKQKIQEKVTEAKKTEKKIAPINDNMRTSIKSKMKENFDIDLSPDDISNISNKILANPTEEGVLKALDNYRNIEIEDDSGIDMDVVRDLKNTIRNTKLDVSSVKNSITDYNDMRKRNFGKLKLGNDGLQIDSFYQELSESHPEYFNKDITNVEDELNYLSDFVNTDFSNTIEYSLTDDDIKGTGIIDDLLSYTNKENLIEETSVVNENAFIDNYDKADIIKFDENRKKSRQQVRAELQQEMGINISDVEIGKDISALNYQLTDPVRVNEKVFGKEIGDKVNKATIYQTKHNTAEKIRWQNKERNEIKSLGIKARSKESAAVQKYGEGSYVDKAGNVHNYGDAELNLEFSNKKTQEKIKNAASVIKSKYDNYINSINEVLTNLGYDEIPKRTDYMRHFQELGDIFSKTGVPFNLNDLKINDLPTDINGLTEFNRPGKNYFASANKREGIKTTYDAITGIDGYIESAGNLIYHTKDIQNYRALSKMIRDTYGQTKGFDNENFNNLNDEQRAKRIKDIQSNKLSKYVAWLDEQANALAGKKGAIDRATERFLGRRIYSVLQTAKKQVGSNMTGLNVGSSITNFAADVQAMAKTNPIAFAKGTISTIGNIFHNDGFIDKSDFLTTRFGSDTISKKLWQKASNAGQIFMSGTDWFTSNQIVRSKYFEGISKGMNEKEAINYADNFAARIMGDRGQGSTAEIFNSKTLGLLTQFQLETVNYWENLTHDTKMDAQGGVKYAASAVFNTGVLFGLSHFFNMFTKKVMGRDVMFDPIEIVKTIFGLDKDEENKSLQDRLIDANKQIVDNLPFANILTGGGRIPTTEAFSGLGTFAKKITGQSNSYGNEIEWKDVGKDFAESLPYWFLPTGYGQGKKTAKGLSMYSSDKPVAGSYTDSGNLRFTADESTWGKIKAGLFGQYSSDSANDYVNSGYKTIDKKHIDELKKLEMNSTEYREYQGDLKEAKKVKDDNGYQKYFDDKGNAYWYDEKNKVVYNSDYKKTTKSIQNLEKATQNLSVYEYINNLDVSKNKKNIMLNNAIKNKNSGNTDYSKYDSYAEFDYSYKNPEKYATIKTMFDFKDYNNYSKEIKQLKKEYQYSDTKERKAAIFDYIDSLNIDEEQKLFLFEDAGYSIKNYGN